MVENKYIKKNIKDNDCQIGAHFLEQVFFKIYFQLYIYSIK